jgi:hypothetical protein
LDKLENEVIETYKSSIPEEPGLFGGLFGGDDY